MNKRVLKITVVAVCWLCLWLNLPIAIAQSVNATSNTVEISLDRLEVLQALIDANLLTRSELRAEIKQADSSELPELQQNLESLNADLKNLRASFEQVAIGSVDVQSLGVIETKFDWRDEVSEILQPIVENLKALTEKPRKINNLQKLIEQNGLQAESINTAVDSINEQLAGKPGDSTQESLLELQETWQRRKADNARALQVAQFQLADLQRSDVSWSDAVRIALSDFFYGRGLTVAIAVGIAVLVWFAMRGVLSLFQFKVKREDQDDFRTRKRLAQYAYRVLTMLLILIAVISVFYVRGDMLLMGLSILAAAAVALGLRQAIPRFINEARILLNLGSVREQERVFYNGLPWQVSSLNMQSILRNPELKGVLRLPLKEISSLISRPAGKEPWYPASKGDFIVLEDERVLQVITLTPESVELKDRGGAITAVPATEFYQWTFRNLCRGGSFGVSTIFGIDYRHQSISLSAVPNRFIKAINEALKHTDHAAAVKNVQVEFQSAGSSSLDYWIYVTLDRTAAKAYTKLNRLIQKTCVSVCTEESWGIPFPHLTIQKFEVSGD